MKPVILIILDGYGIAPPGPGNAIHLANPTNINSYLYSFPNTTLRASGQAVGLPAEEPGNTEVGHLNLGAGKIVFQDLPRINMAIADGSFYKNEALLKTVSHLQKTSGSLHLLGLVSEGSVHSHLDHLFALLYFAKENNLKKVFIHVITDGRDSPPKSAMESVRALEEKLKNNGASIASVMGRYYGMDRDRRWERTEKAYICLTKGEGLRAATASDAVSAAYNTGITDEFIEPTNIVGDNQQPNLINEGDAVIFFNFRIDRPRQLTKAFVLDDFENKANASLSFDPYAVKYYKTHLPQEAAILTPPFKRGNKINNLLFVTMTEYEKNLPVEIAFPPMVVQMPLGRVLAEASMPQLRITESEKERFVTFYFNGQRETPFPMEDRLIVPSPKVPTYDLKPEMSAYELTNILISKMRESKYKLIVVNFPNPDMVGHTGNIQATIIAIKTIDNCLAKIVQEGMALNYSIFVTADHGNAEQKINLQTADISTEHTSNPVPFIFIDSAFQGRFAKLQSGILGDVAPTILSILEVQKPESMTGRNLLEELK